ncbi:MAG: TatD family hydrolase [Pseudomonadota bacterium]|nr:TatD family hydrolase [Pseudomonadota bacterium]
MLIDSHCHLDFDSFDGDIKETIERASKVGVKKMLTICTRFSRFDKILGLANKYEELFCSVGIHPHHVQEEEIITADELISATKNPKVIGIGETGLDFYYNNSPHLDQEKSLRTHIAVARETQLPLIVHTRDADAKMATILKKEMLIGKFPCVLHCFSSGQSLANTALELDLYISLSGIVTFKNAQDLRKIIKNIPLKRLLVETDSPFLAPVPNRGKRNEPSFIIHTATKGAEIKGVSLEEFSLITTKNFFRLFSKANKKDLVLP